MPTNLLKRDLAGEIMVRVREDAACIGFRLPVSSVRLASPWPPWALSMRAQAIPGERGLVETIERTVGPFGGDAFKLWHAATFGPMAGHCNCAALRERWAAEFLYPL